MRRRRGPRSKRRSKPVFASRPQVAASRAPAPAAPPAPAPEVSPEAASPALPAAPSLSIGFPSPGDLFEVRASTKQAKRLWAEASALAAARRFDDAFRRASGHPKVLLGLLARVKPKGADLGDDVKSAVLDFAARAFSRSDVWPRPLLAWLADDAKATSRAVRGDSRADLVHALRVLSVEPTQRGVAAAGLLATVEREGLGEANPFWGGGASREHSPR